MAIRLDTRSSDFAQKFRAFLDTKREASADVEACRARHRRRCRRPRRSGAERLHAQIRQARSRPRRSQGDRRRDRGGALLPAAARRSTRSTSPAPHRGLSPPADAAGRSLYRCARRRARLALDRDRGGRPLRAGRHRGLSVLGADECGAGKGRRRAAARDGGAVARRRTQPAGAGGGETCRRRRDLPHRRRASGRGARLWHRDHRAGRQDRRARATPMWRPPSASCSARSAST